MASFAIVTTTPAPVTASSGSSTVTYNQIVQSQSNYLFAVKKLYLKGTTIDDISLNIQIIRNTPDGQSLLLEENIDVSPFQIQPSIELDLERKGIVFDGFTTFNFEIPPLATVQMLFTTDIINRNKVIQNATIV